MKKENRLSLGPNQFQPTYSALAGFSLDNVDGSPGPAFQYEAAWKEALFPISPCSRAHLLYMLKKRRLAKKGILPFPPFSVADEKTLVVELAPSPYFLELLAQPICVPLYDVKERQPTRFNAHLPLPLGKETIRSASSKIPILEPQKRLFETNRS